MKTCRACEQTLPLGQYPKHNSTRDGHRHECHSCVRAYQRAYRERNADRLRAYEAGRYTEDRKMSVRLRQYGLTLEQYEEMERTQGGACAICRRQCPTGRRLAVDHDHKTGKVRALLCFKCNAAEGALDGRPDLAEALAAYMRRHAG